jgi:hypothetical protein
MGRNYLVGMLLGSLTITGLISRLLAHFVFKPYGRYGRALWSALGTLTFCTVLATPAMGPGRALALYGGTMACWLLLDFFLADCAPPAQPPGEPPSTDPSQPAGARR